MKYQKYADKFTDKPKYLSNCLKAFVAGGIVCEIGYFFQALFMGMGLDKETSGTWSTIVLICLAQLLTGIGWYDIFGKVGGAGAAVPITGFANSIVAPAMDFKREGPVLGVGSKIFSLSGPVILLGTVVSWIAGLAHWLIHIII